MKQITCIGKDKSENNFYYFLEPKGLLGLCGYEVKVYSVANLNYGKFCTIEVYHVSDSEIKIKNIQNHGSEFSAKGIPDGMIPELSKLFFKDIISSSNNKLFQNFADEGRTEHAEKYWKRIQKNGYAVFEKEKDIFRFKKVIPKPIR